MAMDEDEEDFIYFGTPIGLEEETSARKRKAAAAAGQLRALPAWKQEVTDEDGRRRFHGAFTGGFSAGYYNTVGSKEGWTPQSFTSSRKNRAEVKQQSIYNFLDEDEKEEMDGHALETSSTFDTFGFTAAELLRKQAKKDQQKRPSIIPGPIPDEIVLPAMSSIGIKLLVTMGWRHGHSINDTRASSLYGARREARKAFLAFSGNNEEKPEFAESSSSRAESESYIEGQDDDIYSSQTTPVFVLNPKQDLHGLGYDPFKHAPEFRDRKRLRTSKMKDVGLKSTASWKDKLFSSNSGKFAPGFGIGALEELDIEDEDIYDSGFEVQETCIDEVEPLPKMSKDVKSLLLNKEQTLIFGFRPATNSDYKIERFQPPDIPTGFKAQHKFPAPLDTSVSFYDSPPSEVPPPDDNNLRLLVEGFAALVSHCGKLFEDLSREKNKSNPLFSFLNGGNGSDYYARKLWEGQQKRADQKKMMVDIKSSSTSSDQKMTAESRGRALGEKPLEKTSSISTSSVGLPEVHMQSNLSNTFTRPSSCIGFSEFAKPFKNDPAKQERFEQFLKDKFEGGLRSTSSGGTSNWSENDRARERLDFEAVLDTMQKEESIEKFNQPSFQQVPVLSKTRETQFISGGTEMNVYPPTEEKISAKIIPRREEFQWRPAPVLCKRFDITDPFMGKPPPVPRSRSKMDSFIFTSDFINSEKVEESVAAKPLSPSKSKLNETGENLTNFEPDIESKDTTVHKPVDLYKAIFSDDSDDEVEENIVKREVSDPEKKNEGANTTLNRLVAGDFLESLGKELGLDVPTEASYLPSKNSHKEKTSGEERMVPSDYDKHVSTSRRSDRDSQIASGKLIPSSGEEYDKDNGKLGSFVQGDGADHISPQNGTMTMVTSGPDGNNYSDHGIAKVEKDRMDFRSKGHKTRSSNEDYRSGTPDFESSGEHKFQREKVEMEKKKHKSRRKRTHSRRRGSSSDSDLSEDHRNHEKVVEVEKEKTDIPSKEHRTSSTHQQDGGSDTDHSTDNRYHGGSNSKRSSKEQGRKHSKHHRHRRPTHSDHGADGNHLDDRHERKKSERHRKESTYLRSDSHRKHH